METDAKGFDILLIIIERKRLKYKCFYAAFGK